MSYVDNMSLEHLAIHYKKFSDELALEEFKKRDRLSKMTYDEQMAQALHEEPDNQMLFEFAQVERDNLSVKDEWSEAYEAGFSAGKRAGIRVTLEELKPELERRDEIILGHGKDDTGSGNSEAESHRD